MEKGEGNGEGVGVRRGVVVVVVVVLMVVVAVVAVVAAVVAGAGAGGGGLPLKSPNSCNGQHAQEMHLQRPDTSSDCFLKFPGLSANEKSQSVAPCRSSRSLTDSPLSAASARGVWPS